MGLLQSIEEDEKLLTDKPVEETKEELEENVSEETTEDEQSEPEEGQPEEEKEPEKPEVKEEEASTKAFIRMRKENAELRKKLDEVLQKIEAKPEQKQEAVVNQDPEPDRNKNPLEWMEWNTRRLEGQIKELSSKQEQAYKVTEQERIYNSAVMEFQSLESDFRSTVPDYDDVSAAFVNDLAVSFKKLNPELSPQEIGQRVKDHVLYKAAEYARLGLNPVEELYSLAKVEYVPPKREEEKERKPDIRDIAKNKERSAGMAGAKGRSSSSTITTTVAADMPLSEFANLSAEDLKRLEGR